MRSAALSFLILAIPSTMAAQLPILEGLFKKVTDVNLFYTIAWFSKRPTALAGGRDGADANTGTLTGLGFEVSFDIGEFSPRNAAAHPKRPADLDPRWQAELALGYTEVRGFESARPDLDVRGAVRELPAVSLYFSHLPAGADDESSFRHYLGVRTGLAQLQGLRAYVRDSTLVDSIYNGGGTTFQFGILTGLVYTVGPAHVFVEPAYTHRPFSGVEWSGISGQISDLVPRSLDMSTWSLAMGVQIEIGASAGEK
jgi:hypothetical protein